MLRGRLTRLLVIAMLYGCAGKPAQVEIGSAANIPAEAGDAMQARPDHAITAVPGREQPGQINVQARTQQVHVASAPATDVWLRIGNGLSWERHLRQRSVRDKLDWYRRHQDYLDRVAQRAAPYLYYISDQIEQRGLPAELALLPIVESAYQPFAYSPSRASGLWQFIPDTGRRFGLRQNWWYDGRRDVVESTRAALDYLESLHEEFDGNWLLALAAYNSGARNVSRAITRNKHRGRPVDFWSLRLPRETRGYVPSLLAVAELVAQPRRYGVSFTPIPNRPYFQIVNIDSQLDLALAAEFADMTMDEIYTLNPGFNRWATDPKGPHRLLLPLEKLERFQQQLATLPAAKRIAWSRHVIKRGETLSGIAERYHTDVTSLRSVNNIRGSLIRSGHSLLIPRSNRPLNHYSLSLKSRRFRGLSRVGSGQKYEYTIRRGDNLWDIGRRYGVSIAQLCSWNNMNRRQILRPGKKLTLWFDSNRDRANKKSNLTTVVYVPNAGGSTSRYTVRKGDSLWLIARRHGLSVDELLRWNKLSKDKHLHPGQQLLLKNPARLASDA